MQRTWRLYVAQTDVGVEVRLGCSHLPPQRGSGRLGQQMGGHKGVTTSTSSGRRTETQSAFEHSILLQMNNVKMKFFTAIFFALIPLALANPIAEPLAAAEAIPEIDALAPILASELKASLMESQSCSVTGKGRDMNVRKHEFCR